MPFHGTPTSARKAADDDLTRMVEALRIENPDVQIHLRADSGYSAPAIYHVCERLGIDYPLGLKMNPVLKRHSDALLEQAVRQFEQTGRPQRLFTAFWYFLFSSSSRRMRRPFSFAGGELAKEMLKFHFSYR